jgi:glycosyltransferase involved in cell wall biosynthesis
LNYADYYLVTSRELFYEYKTVFPESPPRGLYRDFPDVALIQEFRSMQKSEKPIDVIWVGNSRWGIHHGIEDHKGLHEIVIPLENRFEGSLKFEYIDSAKLRIPHRNVLELIQASRILIQTSKSEGTGLPLLEAAGLGTIVLTTKVGISEDFLNGNLREFIVLRDVESFHSAITHVIDNTAELGMQLMSRFDEYVEEIRYDLLPKDVIPKLKASRSFNRYFTILSFSKWFRRWIIARANTRRFDF